jgi:hypothetical protein
MFIRNRFHAVKAYNYADRDRRGRPRKDDAENFQSFTVRDLPIVRLTDRLIASRIGTAESRAALAELLQAVK